MRFEGWHVKNMALKGGASQNCGACKKWGQPKNSFKFCRDGISVTMQTFYRIALTLVSDVQKLTQISQGSMSLEPLLYYVP